jgi:hypothetical protein
MAYRLLGLLLVTLSGPKINQCIIKEIEMKTLLKTSLLAIVALALLAPAMAQNAAGFFTTWTINLSAPNGGPDQGTAQYITFIPSDRPQPFPTMGYIRFIVQCDYLSLPSPMPLDVFVGGRAKTPIFPYGKFVGRMQVENGSASLLLAAGKAPVVTKGTTVTILTRDGTVVMSGTF